MKIVVAAYCQNRTEQAQKVGATPNRIVRLQNVPAVDSVDNGAIFDPGVQGSVSVDMSGLTKDLHAAILGGAAVSLVIDTGS